MSEASLSTAWLALACAVRDDFVLIEVAGTGFVPGRAVSSAESRTPFIWREMLSRSSPGDSLDIVPVREREEVGRGRGVGFVVCVSEGAFLVEAARVAVRIRVELSAFVDVGREVARGGMRWDVEVLVNVCMCGLVCGRS